MRAAGVVLAIDEAPDYLAAVRAMLAEAGYLVETSLSVGGAIDLLWRQWEAQPDVILLDLHLPLLDGRTFAELYAVLPVRHAPLVVVTGADEQEAREYARLVGAAGLLPKPFDVDELLASIERVRWGDAEAAPLDGRAATGDRPVAPAA